MTYQNLSATIDLGETVERVICNSCEHETDAICEESNMQHLPYECDGCGREFVDYVNIDRDDSNDRKDRPVYLHRGFVEDAFDLMID